MNAEQLARLLGGARRSGNGWLCRCPAHADRTPSLHLSDGSGGRLLWHCFGGCTQNTVRNALAQSGLLAAQGQHRAPRARQRAPARVTGALERERIEDARRRWRAARPVTPDDPAGRYLTSRSLPGPWPATLRFLPSARHPSGDVFSALVAAACRWPDRMPMAVQLTGLTANGRKAPVSPERWTHGVLRGAAVRLSAWREGKPVHVVEGVEDGLAALQALPDATAWAVLGGGNAAHVILPAGAEVVLALDGDDAGRKAAKAAGSALAVCGHRVRIANLPEGFDPNALLIAATTAGQIP